MNKNLHEEIVYSADFELINSPAFYDCVVHLICTAGSGRFYYNGRKFSLEANDIAVISRPRYVTGIAADEDFRCQYIAAPDKFLHNLLPANNYSIQGRVSLFDNPVMKVGKEYGQKFLEDLSNIRNRLSESDHRFYQEMIGSLLQTMIYDLFDFHVRLNDSILTTDRVGYVVSRFFALMEAGRPKTEREVSYYADLLNVTSKYLSDTVKRVSGMSASNHINRTASLIILEYLKDDRLSITQIADEMNFTSVSYFSRYCRKHIGMSPSQFRTAGDK